MSDEPAIYEPPGLDVWVIDVTEDELGEPILEFSELTIVSAKGMVEGFRMGGSIIHIINGGVRIKTPLGYRDVVLKASLDPNWKWKGDSD